MQGYRNNGFHRIGLEIEIVLEGLGELASWVFPTVGNGPVFRLVVQHRDVSVDEVVPVASFLSGELAQHASYVLFDGRRELLRYAQISDGKLRYVEPASYAGLRPYQHARSGVCGKFGPYGFTVGSGHFPDDKETLDAFRFQRFLKQLGMVHVFAEQYAFSRS